MLSFQRRELAAALIAAGRFRLPALAGLATFGFLLAVVLLYRKIVYRIDEARRLTEAGVALYQLLARRLARHEEGQCGAAKELEVG
jgi:hypothetical protein